VADFAIEESSFLPTVEAGNVNVPSCQIRPEYRRYFIQCVWTSRWPHQI